MRRALWALFVSGGRNHPAGEIQVGKRQQREHLRAILGEAAIAYLAIAELAFDDPEHVLDFRTHLAEPAIGPSNPLVESASPPRADVERTFGHRRLVPIGDLSRCNK